MTFIFVDDNFSCKILIAIIKFFTSISFGLIMIYTAELYPVSIKALGVGFVNFIGKFGAATSPIFIFISDQMNISPLVVMGFVVILAGFASTFLPEGLNLSKEEIDEVASS